jgi:hypothetical protein
MLCTLILIPACLPSKVISYAVWYPGIARAHVTLARGIHFSAMGHSAPRQHSTEDGVQKIQKRLELLPEETIYLVERGTLFCWKESLLDVPGMEDIPGPPMSVQQVYSEMIGTEDLTLERFQVRTTSSSFLLVFNSLPRFSHT